MPFVQLCTPFTTPRSMTHSRGSNETHSTAGSLAAAAVGRAASSAERGAVSSPRLAGRLSSDPEHATTTRPIMPRKPARTRPHIPSFLADFLIRHKNQRVQVTHFPPYRKPCGASLQRRAARLLCLFARVFAARSSDTHSLLPKSRALF